MRVLVVEDDEAIRERISVFLEAEGYWVAEAATLNQVPSPRSILRLWSRDEGVWPTS
jgi:DNA-binding response OmpR family regulator